METGRFPVVLLLNYCSRIDDHRDSAINSTAVHPHVVYVVTVGLVVVFSVVVTVGVFTLQQVLFYLFMNGMATLKCPPTALKIWLFGTVPCSTGTVVVVVVVVLAAWSSFR